MDSALFFWYNTGKENIKMNDTPLQNDDLREKVRNAIVIEMGKGRSSQEIIDLALRAGAPEALIREELETVQAEQPKKKIHLNWKWMAYGGAGLLSVTGGIAFALWLPTKDNTSVSEALLDTTLPAEEQHAAPEEKDKKIEEGVMTETEENSKENEEVSPPEENQGTTEEMGNNEDTPETEENNESEERSLIMTEEPESPDKTENAGNTETALPLFLRVPEQIPLASGKYSILSSDPSRLNIALNGSVLTITGYEPGTATVTLVEESSSRKFSFEVAILPEEETERTLSLALEVGKKKYIRSFVGQKVTVTTSDDSVAKAKISGSGILVISAEIPGEAEISVTNTENSLTTVYELTVSGSVEKSEETKEENKSAEIMGKEEDSETMEENSSNGEEPEK